jgi:hypothetical protein
LRQLQSKRLQAHKDYLAFLTSLESAMEKTKTKTKLTIMRAGAAFSLNDYWPKRNAAHILIGH